MTQALGVYVINEWLNMLFDIVVSFNIVVVTTQHKLVTKNHIHPKLLSLYWDAMKFIPTPP